MKSIANINVDVVCTSFYEWAPILKTILESGLAPPFCLPRQLQDISSAPNGRHALPPEIKRREQISLESSIWYKEATLQFDCWLLKKKRKKKKHARWWCLHSSGRCLQLCVLFLRRFTNGKTYATLEIQLYAENYTGQPISRETYLHVQVCVDCFRSLKESESVQLMIHEVLTSEIKSHSLPGVATIISGHLFKSLCCFWGAIPPTTATILEK